MLQFQRIDVCFSSCLRCTDGHLAPYTSLSCLVALDDVTLDNGPVRLVEGSHLVGQRVIDSSTEHHSTVSTNDVSLGEGKENFKEANGSRVIMMDMGNEEGTPITMSRGQVLIMHCHMMHCSQPNLSDRPRRILFMRYADADAVEVYNPGTPPRLGRLLCGTTKFPEVARFGENRCERPDHQTNILRGEYLSIEMLLLTLSHLCVMDDAEATDSSWAQSTAAAALILKEREAARSTRN